MKNSSKNDLDFYTRYNGYRIEIQEHIKYFINKLIEKYGELTDTYLISLDLLAMNLEIMYKSMDEIRNKGLANGVDQRYQGAKSAAMQAFFNSQNYVHKIISNFGFSPMSKSKMRENKEKIDVDKFIQDLTA